MEFFQTKGYLFYLLLNIILFMISSLINKNKIQMYLTRVLVLFFLLYVTILSRLENEVVAVLMIVLFLTVLLFDLKININKLEKRFLKGAISSTVLLGVSLGIGTFIFNLNVSIYYAYLVSTVIFLIVMVIQQKKAKNSL